MLSKCEVHNVNGSDNYTLDSAPVTAGYSALISFHPDVEDRTITDRGKMQGRGLWPTFSYEGGMSIEMQGRILADTPTHAIAQLDLFTRAFRGQPLDAISSRRRGTIFIRRLDKTEDWKVDYGGLMISAPITAEIPVIEWMVTVFCFKPYFTGVTSGNLFFWT